MITRFISVDCGKADTKQSALLNSDNSISRKTFPTRVKEITDKNGLEALVGRGETGFIVEYDDKVYAVGDLANTDDSFTSNQNSKNDQTHKIATLTAIAGSVKNDDWVKAVIGCPIELYSNDVNRNNYLDNILPSGRIDISINGVHKNFTITGKKVLPESLGILFVRPELFVDKLVGVIDIGGLNVNAVMVDNANLVSGSAFTDKLGRRSLENDIRKYANDTYESTFSATEINAFIRQGYITDNLDPKKEEESKLIINKALENQLVKIVSTCVNHGWNLTNMDLVFVGGGSSLLADKIKMAFPRAHLAENTVYANSDGFLISLCLSERISVRV